MNQFNKNNMIEKSQYLLLLLLFCALPSIAQNKADSNLFIIKTLNYLNDPTEAIKHIDNKINSSNNYELKMEIANTYYLLGEFKTAINYYLEANTLNGKVANFELAKCYAQLDKAEFTCKYLSNYLSSKNKLPLSRVKSDNAFEPISDTKEWLMFWGTDWYSNNEILYNDADYEYRIENYNESINILERIISKRPSYQNAHSLLYLNYMELGNFNDALQCIDYAIKLNSKSHKFYYQRSYVLFELDKHKKALKDINNAISIDYTFIDYFLLRINIYLKLQQNSLAENEMIQLLNFTENSAIYRLAAKTYYQNENYLAALKYYNKCVEQKSFGPDLYIDRGDVYLKCGPYEYAENDFSIALDFFPTMGELYFKRALARIEQKKYEAACRDLNKARNYGFIKSEDWIKRFCQ